MRALVSWLFQDLVDLFAPGSTNARGSAPTRSGAWRLIGIGLLVTAAGAIAISIEANPDIEKQSATIVGRHESAVYLSPTRTIRQPQVTLRLEDGTVKDVELGKLYDDIGTQTEVPVKADVAPRYDSVNAVYWRGKRYGTGNAVAGVIVAIIIALAGLIVTLSGGGRLRRWRYAQNA